MVGTISADSWHLHTLPPSVVGSVCAFWDNCPADPCPVGASQTVFYEQASNREILNPNFCVKFSTCNSSFNFEDIATGDFKLVDR